MKKFNVVVTRTDEYEKEVDENVWNEKELADWSKTFHHVSDQWDVAQDLAERVIRQGHSEFIEGYGHIAAFRKKDGYEYHSYTKSKCPGIKLTVISEDEDYQTEVKEL